MRGSNLTHGEALGTIAVSNRGPAFCPAAGQAGTIHAEFVVQEERVRRSRVLRERARSDTTEHRVDARMRDIGSSMGKR
jgi:hypothetical protein